MKKQYEEVKAVVVDFGKEDIVTTSDATSEDIFPMDEWEDPSDF